MGAFFKYEVNVRDIRRSKVLIFLILRKNVKIVQL